MKYEKFIGIDNGLKGGIAVIGADGKAIEVIDMPVLVEKIGKKMRNRYDIQSICNFLQKHSTNSYCIFEKGHAMPGQGTVSMVSIGYCNGMLDAFLTALHIPYETISSRKWQNIFSITGDTKYLSFENASKLFPEINFKGKKGGVMFGRTDAVLIAEYGRRKMLGDNSPED